MSKTIVDIRQLNQTQLSGLCAQVAAGLDLTLSGNLASLVSGLLTSGAFYPLNNPSGYFAGGKYSTYVGDGASTGISVNHNLGTRDIFVSIYKVTGNNEMVVAGDGGLALMGGGVAPTIYNTGTNGLLLGFSSAPATNSLRVVVFG